MIKKLNNKINEKAMFFFIIFLFLQPILDMLIGLFYSYNIVSSIISIFKVLFMFFCIYYVLIIKKKNIKYILFLFIYCIIFLVTNFLLKNNVNIFFEFKILLKNIFLPITLIFVINLLKEKQFDMQVLYKILIIYLFLIFIPNILNIGYNSYSTDKLGSVGFFYSANSTGGIISILMPLLIGKFIINNDKKQLILFLLMYLYILVTIGTKAPILCALIVAFYYFILFILNSIKKQKKLRIIMIFLFIIIAIMLGIKIFPLTPVYKNLIMHLEFLNIDSFKDILTFKNIDHFIFSARLSCFKKSLNLFLNSSIIQKLFGLGYVINGNLFRTSEMDYLVAFIHHGIIGFIILYYLYFKILFSIFKNYFRELKVNFQNISKTSNFASIVISILCAFLAGHILDSPSACIFVVTIIGNFYIKLENKE